MREGFYYSGGSLKFYLSKYLGEWYLRYMLGNGSYNGEPKIVTNLGPWVEYKLGDRILCVVCGECVIRWEMTDKGIWPATDGKCWSCND